MREWVDSETNRRCKISFLYIYNIVYRVSFQKCQYLLIKLDFIPSDDPLTERFHMKRQRMKITEKVDWFRNKLRERKNIEKKIKKEKLGVGRNKLRKREWERKEDRLKNTLKREGEKSETNYKIEGERISKLIKEDKKREREKRKKQAREWG